MNFKGNVRRAGQPINFWGKHSKRISKELKDFVYDQYYSLNSLYVYCDGSMQKDSEAMGIACSFVKDGRVCIRKSLIYPPNDCVNVNVYAEMYALNLCFQQLHNFIDYQCDYVYIFSDVDHIGSILSGDSQFKKRQSLKNLQAILQRNWGRCCNEHPQVNISVEYLQKARKYSNPFAKSAHNAAKNLLTH